MDSEDNILSTWKSFQQDSYVQERDNGDGELVPTKVLPPDFDVAVELIRKSKRKDYRAGKVYQYSAEEIAQVNEDIRLFGEKTAKVFRDQRWRQRDVVSN